MRFTYSTLKQHTSRVGRYALLVVIISLVALSGLLVSGSASSQDKFTMAEATTTESDGKLLKARPGFALKIKNQSRGEVVAYKVEKDTVLASDTLSCTCTHPLGDLKGKSCKASLSGPNATCSGNCQKCSWE